jgi:hypothetical protein
MGRRQRSVIDAVVIVTLKDTQVSLKPIYRLLALYLLVKKPIYRLLALYLLVKMPIYRLLA